jgi:hypothetical protein
MFRHFQFPIQYQIIYQKISFRMMKDNLLQNSILLIIAMLFSTGVYAQCCSGGSGSPIAGGASQGVLEEGQVELNTNLQFIRTDKFITGSEPDTAKYFDSFSSTYQYFRLAYGLSRNLTMSLETGNYFEKKEVGLNQNKDNTYSSHGISDLILFPRYDLINRSSGPKPLELTIGIGFKIPLGSYHDSSLRIEPFSGNSYYISKPQAVQLSSGAQDIIFYSFLYRGFPLLKFRVFATAMFIKKGWNPVGEKLGDYGSIAVFAGKSFLNHFGATLQLRAEWVDKMKLNSNILLYAYPNYDPEATGYKKVFVTPQISFTKENFTVYALSDIPVYQYLTKTQVGSKHLFTAGISYKFHFSKHAVIQGGALGWVCPMHPEVISDKPGACPKCGMDLEKEK